MQRLTFSIALLFSFAVTLASNPASAQFRFQSGSGRSASSSIFKGRSIQQKTTKQSSGRKLDSGGSKSSGTKQTTTKSTGRSKFKSTQSKPQNQTTGRSRAKSISSGKAISQSSKSSRTSRQSLINNRLKSSNKNSGKSSKGPQLNGSAKNQSVQSRENRKTGFSLFETSRINSQTTSRNKGRGKQPSPFDPKAMNASKGKQLGIFPGERGSGKTVSLGKAGRPSRSSSNSSSASRNGLLDQIPSKANRNPVSKEDLIHNIRTPDGRGPGGVRGNDDDKPENTGRGTNVVTEDDRQSGSSRLPGNQDLIDILKGNDRRPGTSPGKDNSSPEEPQREDSRTPDNQDEAIRDQFEDWFNGGNRDPKNPGGNNNGGNNDGDTNEGDATTDESSAEPGEEPTDEPVPNEGEPQEGETGDEANETQQPETDDQQVPVDDTEEQVENAEEPIEDAEEQVEPEPEPTEEQPPIEDVVDQEQDNGNLDSLIDLLDNLPIGGNIIPTGPIVIERPVIVTPSQPTEVETNPNANLRRIRTDLEVLDIRFVDLGNADRNEGPRFRVFLKNHNNRFSLENVQVDLLAGIELATEDSPRQTTSGIVETIAPQGTASLDIRVSRESLNLVDPETGQTAAFRQLAAIADPNDAFEDMKPENNVIVKDVNGIEHVDLKLNKLAVTEWQPNRQVVLHGEGFQFDAGTVVLIINQKPHPLKITSWSPTTIEATVPNFVLITKIEAKLTVVRPDKSFTEPQAVSINN